MSEASGLGVQAFERGMQHLDKAYGFLSSPHEYISRKVDPCAGCCLSHGNWLVAAHELHLTEMVLRTSVY